MSDPVPPLLLAVDGNSLLHRAHHAWAGSPETDRDGRPIWGLIGLVVAVAAAVARCRPDALVVGFDCTERSLRRELSPGYKAHRPGKPAELVSQLADAPDLLTTGGVPVVRARGHEADDVLASAAAAARRSGWRTVLVTSDRDAFAALDPTTSMLRVVNGGIDDSPLLGPADIERIYGVTPRGYRDLAALRGDPSDNLRGVPGVGARVAARLLHRFGSLDALLAALDEPGANSCADPTDPNHPTDALRTVRDLAGPAALAHLTSAAGRADLSLTRRLMALREDIDVPDLDALRLPQDGVRLRSALRDRDIRLTGSLWAMVGEQPPPWSPNGFDRAPATLPRVGEPPWALSQWYSGQAVGETATPTTDPTVDITDGAAPAGAMTRGTCPPRRGHRPPRPVPAGQLALF